MVEYWSKIGYWSIHAATEDTLVEILLSWKWSWSKIGLTENGYTENGYSENVFYWGRLISKWQILISRESLIAYFPTFKEWFVTSVHHISVVYTHCCLPCDGPKSHVMWLQTYSCGCGWRRQMHTYILLPRADYWLKCTGKNSKRKIPPVLLFLFSPRCTACVHGLFCFFFCFSRQPYMDYY